MTLQEEIKLAENTVTPLSTLKKLADRCECLIRCGVARNDRSPR